MFYRSPIILLRILCFLFIVDFWCQCATILVEMLVIPQYYGMYILKFLYCKKFLCILSKFTVISNNTDLSVIVIVKFLIFRSLIKRHLWSEDAPKKSKEDDGTEMVDPLPLKLQNTVVGIL